MAIVAITGASGGIGAATARACARRGHAVALVARRRDALEAVAAACEGAAGTLVHVADVTDRAAVRGAVAATVAKLGGLDVWINNAGRGITRMPSELTDADVEDMMRVNVLSALYGMQETLPHFRAQERGHVINVSSMLGRVPFATHRSAYVGAKHFLDALTATFRTEVQATHPGIEYSLVSPPVVRTEFGANALHGGPASDTFPDSQSAEDVAAVIAGVIDSRAPDVYTRPGAQARVAAYYARLGADPS